MVGTTHFDIDGFRNPPTLYWPGYHWALVSPLARQRLARQLQHMLSQGARSVTPVPIPSDFRPQSFPSTMTPPQYLSEEYLAAYKGLVEEVHRLGMCLWLWDEGGWPAGSAGGRIVRENPNLAQQTLECDEVQPSVDDKITVPADCLSAFLYQDTTLVKRLPPGATERIHAEHMAVEVYRVVRRKDRYSTRLPYPDLLNPESTRRFIELTYEAYKRTVGEHFGSTIPAMFTDEPKVANPPWTDGLAADFKEKYGYDICDYLPSLVHADRKEGMQARVDFLDWWSNRFAEAYFGRIHEWCRGNNVLLSGHLAGDHDTLSARSCGYGHAMRMLRHFDIPGVDTIWRELFPIPRDTRDLARGPTIAREAVAENHHFPKYASSVAHQENRRWAMTESCAAYGSGLTIEQMKWLIDYQYVRGITLCGIGGYISSTQKPFTAGLRPIFNPVNPLEKYLAVFYPYVARLGYLLSLGEPGIGTAVYFPVRDVWAGGSELKRIVRLHDLLAKRLLEHQCDFDLIDDDVLGRSSTKVVAGRLCVGPMRYHTVCVARTRWMTDGAKEKLARFSEGGGKVLWVDDADGLPGLSGSRVIGLQQLNEHVAALVKVVPVSGMLKACRRELHDGNLYFLTNEGGEAIDCTVRFDEHAPMVRVDPETGDCWRPPEACHAHGTWSLPLHLEFAGSCVVMFTEAPLPLADAPARKGKALLRLKDGWSWRKIKEYRIGKENFEVEEGRNDQPSEVELGDWRPILGDDFSGDVEYCVEFEAGKNAAQEACFLHLGDVRYACEVTFNGKNLGKKAWQPFSFSVRGMVREGTNKLRAVVTNTLANQYLTTSVFDQWPESVLGPYHRLALSFEKDSLPSGLFGPVRILSGSQATP